MIEGVEGNEWGVCEEEDKKEFLTHMKKFSQDIHEAVDTLSGVIELQKLDPKFEDEARATGKQPSDACMKHCQSLVDSWMKVIDQYVNEWNENEERKPEPTEEGPLSELEHWRQTQRILTGISEQIKGPGCTTVLNLLHIAKLSNSANKDSIGSFLSSWKKKEGDLTEKLNEAKDNVKYLRTLEPYMESLYSGNPTLIIESMRGLMHAIKMMFSIAKHYDKGSRMTILFSKITWQMIASCIQAITKGKSPSQLWDTSQFPVGPLSKIFESCIKLNAEYKKEFNDIKQKLNANPKGKHYEFTDTAIFGKFDLFCRRVGKLKDLFETIEQFQVLAKHNLESMSSILVEFQGTLETLKKSNLDRLLDYKKNDFDIDFVSFNAYVSQIESRLMQFISEKVSQEIGRAHV
jgi:dynein heavy chain